MNYQKSGVMAVRVDRRTPVYKARSTVLQVPVVTQYKYLGLLLDDCGDMKPLSSSLKSLMTAYKRQLSLSWAYKLPSKVKLLAWSSLIKSKFLYGLFCAAKVNPNRVRPRIKSFLYNSLKNLFQLKSKPKADTLFQLALGTSCEEWIDLHVHQQAVQLKLEEADSERLDRLRESKEHLAELLAKELKAVTAFLCGRLLNPYHKKKKHVCLCGNSPVD